jgi:RNA polymerase sigma-70 factor, ECF subfamily
VKNMNDASLVEKFRNGDTHAFNLLVNRWQEPIFRFTYGYFGNISDSDDVTQKTFIKAYQKIESLKETEKFSAWLYRIANHLCIDQTRQNHRRESSLLENWKKNSETVSPITPEITLEKNELSLLIHKALLSIPDDQRTVIILKEYEGLKFREIAEILEESENTIKSRMYYGLKALRKVFKKWNIEKEALHYG